jgi:CheY-like chemotaxis protein
MRSHEAIEEEGAMNGMHIIVCSDNPVVVEATVKAYDPDETRLTLCESGMELLAAVRALAADRVILDLGTHGLGGLLLVSAIRELAPGLSIIAVSAHPDVDDRPLVQQGVPFLFLGAVDARSRLRELTTAGPRGLALSGARPGAVTPGRSSY